MQKLIDLMKDIIALFKKDTTKKSTKKRGPGRHKGSKNKK
jgi:hypothetical protein